MQKQNNFSQIAALNFRRVALGTIELAALGPESMASSWRSSPGATFALVGGSAADFFEKQSSDAALGIVTSVARLPVVHDATNDINRHRGISDIRGNNNFAERIWCEGEVLFFRLQFAVQRNQRAAPV